MLVLHGEWFRHPKYGLVGPMDDQDAARLRSLVPHAHYKKIVGANHVMHMFKPTEFVEVIKTFAGEIAFPSST